jgi:hypothetical protein
MDNDHLRIQVGLALWRSLDITPDDRDRVWTQSGPAEQFGMDWPGWQLSFLGLTTTLGPAEAAAATDRPRMIFETPDGRYLGCVELRLQQAWREAVDNIITERVWHPELGEQKRLVLTEGYDAAQLVEADRGFDLLAQAALKSQRGRPDLYTNANEVDFFNELGKAAHAAVRAGEHVSYSSLTRHGMHSRATYTAGVKKFGYELSLIEAEAVRCIKQRHNCAFLVRDRARFKKSRV